MWIRLPFNHEQWFEPGYHLRQISLGDDRNHRVNRLIGERCLLGQPSHTTSTNVNALTLELGLHLLPVHLALGGGAAE